MPANLGNLPPELLLKINEFFFTGDDNPVPQFYLRLALVNRRFYEVFLSDHLWNYLDVHDVQKDIAAHYIRLKKGMLSKELEFCAGFDYAKWAHPAVTVEQFTSFSFYTQASILTSTEVPRGLDFLRRQINNHSLIAYAARTWNGLCFAKLSLTEDAEFMMKVADAGGSTAYYASDALKDNRDFILKCVSGSFSALRDCSQRLKDDKEVALAHIDKWWSEFPHVSETLRDDRDVAMAAVNKNPFNLGFCSERLRDDPEVVKAAVQGDGIVLQWASDRFKRDMNTVLIAFFSNRRSFEFAHESCQQRILQRGASSFAERP